MIHYLWYFPKYIICMKYISKLISYWLWLPFTEPRLHQIPFMFRKTLHTWSINGKCVDDQKHDMKNWNYNLTTPFEDLSNFVVFLHSSDLSGGISNLLETYVFLLHRPNCPNELDDKHAERKNQSVNQPDV